MDLSNRQWRALAQAYPYYFPSSSDVAEEDPAEEAEPSTSQQRTEFAQYVVPRACKAFPAEVEAWSNTQADNGQPPSPLAAAEAIFTHFFNRPALFSSTPPSPAAVLAAAPLTPREVQLLSLYHRKQTQYEYVYSSQQPLVAAAQGAVRTLQSALSSVEVMTSTEDGLQDSTRESLLWLGGTREVAAAALRPPSSAAAATTTTTVAATAAAGFTSALAHLPYTMATSTTTHTALPGSIGLPPSLVVVNRCAGCGEVDGDLLVCTQCEEVRHEACGGPHPPERNRVDGSLPSINLCKKCAKALNLSSSSSSLHSSTSSSERAALEDYFDSEEDSESSLSGFVVHSSDAEEEDEEEEGNSNDGSSRSRSSDGAHHDHDKEKRDSANSTAPRQHHTTDTISSSKKKDNKPVKKQSHRRHDEGSRSDSVDDDEDGEEERPRRPEKRRRREATRHHRRATSEGSSKDEAGSPSSSSSSSSFSASPPSKQPRRQQQQRSPAHASSFVATKKGTKAASPATPLSTQEKRRAQDEQDELTMLGIAAEATPTRKSGEKLSKVKKAAASSAEASPMPSQSLHQQQQCAVGSATKSAKKGRRSVVNVASSSSSSGSDSD